MYSSSLPNKNYRTTTGDLAIIMGFVYDIFTRDLKNILFKIIGVIIAIIVIPPLLLVLFILTWRLKRSYSSEVIITTDNYKSLRIEYDSLNSYLAALPKTSTAISINKIGWILLYPILHSICKIRDAYYTRRNKIKEALDIIDLSNSGIEPFKAISENELWNRRSSAADYLFK